MWRYETFWLRGLFRLWFCFKAFPRSNDPSAPTGHLPFREDLGKLLPEGEVAAKPTEGSLVQGFSPNRSTPKPHQFRLP